jgi:hypothetical protein
LFAQSQAQVTLDYIKKYKGIAISEMKRTGIPASITLAQAIVESGSGESKLAKEANNHFGIKCKTEWTGEKMYKDDDMKNECFRVYYNADSSFIDHSNFLKYRPYYASLFELDPVDDTAWAYGLKKAGYATEKDYPSSLLKVIDLYELSQYNFPELVAEDSIEEAEKSNINFTDSDSKKLEKTLTNNDTPSKALAIKPTPTKDSIALNSISKDTIIKPLVLKDTVVKIVKVTDTVVKVVVVKDTVVKVITVRDTVEKINTLKANAALKDTAISKINDVSNNAAEAKKVIKEAIKEAKAVNYPKNVKFKINGVSAIWAEKDRSYLEIANTYNVAVYKLYKNNELEESDLVQKEQLLFLGEKKKDSDKKVHVAKNKASFYDIAQMEGIQLAALKSYNSNIIEAEIKEGTIIYLFNMPKEPVKPVAPEKVKESTQQKATEKNSSNPIPKKNKFKIF